MTDLYFIEGPFVDHRGGPVVMKCGNAECGIEQLCREEPTFPRTCPECGAVAVASVASGTVSVVTPVANCIILDLKEPTWVA
jgi:hypothetical protein